jgi:hypothetical protein
LGDSEPCHRVISQETMRTFYKERMRGEVQENQGGAPQ